LTELSWGDVKWFYDLEVKLAEFVWTATKKTQNMKTNKDESDSQKVFNHHG